MNAAMFKRIRDLYEEALPLQGTARSEALDRCDDQEVRDFVIRMLAADDRDTPPLPQLTGSQGSTVETPTRVDTPDRIGPFHVLGEIGSGGMGTVYHAEQTYPIRRHVAVKVIKRGMDSKALLARFAAERQALALMNHPNIATVLEAGETEDHRPYFAMEWVDGEPITRFCDRHELSTRDRLSLFVHVCSAVQHAHERGVVHRDLKPSNVLVAMRDGMPTPKVIDFGIAKAMATPLTDESVHTRFGQILGTPEYMSPEQVDARAHAVDARSDVYSLGVILFELLTGGTPYSSTALKGGGLDQMRRLIVEEDTPRPSSRVEQSREHSEAVAKARHTTAHRLVRELRGDVDWIVLKALEKDRDHRYETVARLADDVSRSLSDLPVSAGPPSAITRFRKALRRNRMRASLASALLLAAASVALILSSGPTSTPKPTLVGRVHRLTFTGDVEIGVWSPVADEIAYSTSSGGSPRAILTSADGRESRVIYDGGFLPWNWAPDGKHLLGMGPSIDQSTVDILMLDVGDGTVERIIEQAMFPDVSPDGRQLAYHVRVPRDSNGLWIMELESRTAHRVHGPAPEGSNYYKPQFSPDGGRIAYSRWTGQGHELWILDLADGSDRKVETGAVEVGGHFDWTKDGRFLMTAGASDGAWSMWKVPIDGSAPIRFTQEGGERHASASPDGGAFVFHRTSDATRVGILDLESRSLSRPFDLQVAARSPCFGPTGEWVVFQAVIGDRWQLREIDIQGRTPARPVGESGDYWAFDPTVLPDGCVLHVRANDRPLFVHGAIEWPQTLWITDPRNATSRRIAAAGDRLLRIAPSAFRTDRWLFAKRQTSVTGLETVVVLFQDGREFTVWTDRDDFYCSAFDWGRDDLEVLVAHQDTVDNALCCVSAISVESGTTARGWCVAEDAGTDRPIRGLSMAPDRQHVAILLGGIPQSVGILDLATGALRWAHEFAPDERPGSPRWSPDGRQLVLPLEAQTTDLYVWQQVPAQ